MTAIVPFLGTRSTVKTEQDGKILDLGPGTATSKSVGTVTVQFTPSLDWDGSFSVMGQSVNANTADPFIPIPYRPINVNGAASTYVLSSDPITGSGIIQIPSNGMRVGLLVGVNGGTCGLLVSRMDGPSAI